MPGESGPNCPCKGKYAESKSTCMKKKIKADFFMDIANAEYEVIRYFDKKYGFVSA